MAKKVKKTPMSQPKANRREQGTGRKRTSQPKGASGSGRARTKGYPTARRPR